MNTGAWTNLTPAPRIVATRALVPRGEVVEDRRRSRRAQPRTTSAIIASTTASSGIVRCTCSAPAAVAGVAAIFVPAA
jgi:hypothetical protein